MKYSPYPEERFITCGRAHCSTRRGWNLALWAFLFLLAFAAACFLHAGAALAQASTDLSAPSGNTVSAAPFISALKPYIDALTQVAVTALVGLGVALISKYTGVKIPQSAVESLKSAASTEAGKMVAASENNLAGQTFTASSPVVVKAAAAIAVALPEAMKLSGATPDKVAGFVAGELGKIQGSAMPAPAASSAVAAPK